MNDRFTDQRLRALPENIQKILQEFTEEAISTFPGNLVGVYLHGSAAMGCFNEKTSDLDLIVVVKEEPEDREKRAFLEAVLLLSSRGPKKGIEMSVVRSESCRSFVFPTPFSLHFSEAHRGWFEENPADYIEKMKGTDPDLAAHFMILRLFGLCLYGAPVPEVFELPDSGKYLESIEEDIGGADEEIRKDPVYFTLNLLRVLAYKEENLVLSKRQAGEWAEERALFPEYREWIRHALQAYEGGAAGRPEEAPEEPPEAFAGALLKEIRETPMKSRRSWVLTPENVSLCLEDRVVRVRSDEALRRVLRAGRKAGRRFTQSLIEAYRAYTGKALRISCGSLYGEIRLHAFADRVFLRFAGIFSALHLKPLAKLCLRLHDHAGQIDCGERSVDSNRIVFDLLSPFYGGK